MEAYDVSFHFLKVYPLYLFFVLFSFFFRAQPALEAKAQAGSDRLRPWCGSTVGSRCIGS